MKRERLKAELLSGHKVAAIEVPFDPAKQWAIQPKHLSAPLDTQSDSGFNSGGCLWHH
jgi:hypothetical protein